MMGPVDDVVPHPVPVAELPPLKNEKLAIGVISVGGIFGGIVAAISAVVGIVLGAIVAVLSVVLGLIGLLAVPAAIVFGIVVIIKAITGHN